MLVALIRRRSWVQILLPLFHIDSEHKMQRHTFTPKLDTTSHSTEWAGSAYVGIAADSNQPTGKRAAEVIR